MRKLKQKNLLQIFFLFIVLYIMVRLKLANNSSVSKTLSKTVRAQGLAKFFSNQTVNRRQISTWRFKTERGVDYYRTEFLINHPEFCSNENGDQVYILVLVTSYPEHARRRKGIRDTWGKETLVENKRIRVLFLLGYPEDQSGEVQRRIMIEDNQYGDIVQSDFNDVTQNATLKTVVGIQWAVKYCANSQFVIKSTDKMFLNVPSIVNKLQDRKPMPRVLCHVLKNTKPIRDVALVPNNPEYVISADVYPEATYPPYCSGNIMIMSLDTVVGLYAASMVKQLLPAPDDVNLGILTGNLNISPEHESQLRGAFLPHDGTKACWLRNEIAGFINNDPHLEDYRNLWNVVRNESFVC